MTPRQRVQKAMNMEKPDRTPVMCQFSIGFMNQQLKEIGITPMELWLDAEKYAQALMWLREQFDFDGILVSIHGHTLNWRDEVKKIELFNGVEKVTFNDRTETYVDDDLPLGNFFAPREKDFAGVNIDDIPEELDYIPASKDCYIFIDKKEPYRIFNLLDDALHGEYSLHGEVTSPFDYLLDYIGYENALMALMTEPDKVKEILAKFTVGVIKMAEGLAENTDIDAIKISSPFVGMGFISPDQYREFELPWLKELAQAIKNKGKFSYVHTCGHIDDRLELMAQSGVSGLECLDPPPIGNVELEDAFNRIGESMFIKGNVDSVHTLLNGTEATIIDDVTARLNIGARNKGFILSTACSIAPKVLKEHVQLLAKIVTRTEG